MRKILLFLGAVLSAGFLAAATSTPKGFIDDYDLALKRASTEKKPIVAVFTGSDWCPWCQKLEGEVLSKPAFVTGASDYVLLYIDMPQDKSLLSPKAARENAGLCTKYAIRGYPTVLILDAQGKKLASTGYRAGGEKAYLEHLEKLVKMAPVLSAVIEPLNAKFNGLIQKLVDEYPTSKDRAALVKKYLPQIEAALAEAKKLEVPEAVRAERDSIVARVERFVRMVKASVGKETK